MSPELFVNGRSLGKKKAEKFGYLTWKDVIYESGELMAVGDCGAVKDTIVTPGMAAGIEIKLEYFHGDILIVNAAIVDAEKNVVPGSNVRRSFKGLAQAVFKVYNF